MFQSLHRTVLKLEKTPNLHKFSPLILTIGYQYFTANFQVSQIQTRGVKTYAAPGTTKPQIWSLLVTTLHYGIFNYYLQHYDDHSKLPRKQPFFWKLTSFWT